MRWVLLLRAVNLGPTNKLAMADLRALLEGLGHEHVKTHVNSGNATFTSSKRSPRALGKQIEAALAEQLDLNVRACVCSGAEIAKALDELPDLPGYVTVTILFEQPDPAVLRDFLATDWSPEVVEGNDRVVYIGFRDAGRTRLTLAKVEKVLGVSATARTAATLAELLRRGTTDTREARQSTGGSGPKDYG